MRRTVLAALAAAAALAACDSPKRDGAAVEVREAIVTLPAVADRPGAAYFTLEAPRDGVLLLRVESPRAERAEMHDAGMQAAPEVILPAGEELRFAPGDRHVMLFGLDPALRPGERMPLTFTFAGAAPVTTEAQVRAPGDVHRAD